jgi:hypothetical protein
VQLACRERHIRGIQLDRELRGERGLDVRRQPPSHSDQGAVHRQALPG